MVVSTSKSFPDYKNPPVIEVACGFTFETINSFKATHIGLFWQKIRKKFPICEHAIRLESDPSAFPAKFHDLSKYLPRIWFINKDQNMLIQLQDNKFYFNWRKQQNEEQYPRYKTIIKAFKSNLSIFQKFLEEEELDSIKPQKCELTYINHIPKGEGWKTLNDMGKVFRDLKWSSRKRFLKNPQSIGGRVIFPMPGDKGLLNVNLQHGERKIDQHPLLVLQIRAEGLGEDKSLDAVWEWFEIAHEWIVFGFTDLTEKSIQEKVWQRIA